MLIEEKHSVYRLTASCYCILFSGFYKIIYLLLGAFSIFLFAAKQPHDIIEKCRKFFLLVNADGMKRLFRLSTIDPIKDLFHHSLHLFFLLR